MSLSRERDKWADSLSWRDFGGLCPCCHLAEVEDRA